MNEQDVRALFGKKVRQFRKRLGLSQEEFAHRVGIDRTYIGGVERGERNVGLLNICRIARSLHVDPDELFQWKEFSGDE